MSLFHNYDPGRVVAAFRGIPILGYADGTFIAVERAEDAFTSEVGAGGDVTRVRSRNRTGTATFTLLSSSPTNDLFSGVALEDEMFGTGVGPLLVKDLNGTTLIEAPVAWIKKSPAVEYAKEAGSREWVIECAELFMKVGGAVA